MRVILCLLTKNSSTTILKAQALSESDMIKGSAIEDFILEQNTLITRDIGELLKLTHHEENVWVYSNTLQNVTLRYILSATY